MTTASRLTGFDAEEHLLIISDGARESVILMIAWLEMDKLRSKVKREIQEGGLNHETMEIIHTRFVECARTLGS